MTNVFDEAITGNGLVAAFQRVVSLPSERVVGYEALARWPALNNPAPTDIFIHAEKTGRSTLLDHKCIRAAARGALQGSSTPGMLLLVNCEPATAHVDPFKDLDVMQAAASFHLTFEFTERGLMSNPGVLLRKVAALRSLGFAIALDDVGARPDSLALLDLVEPDILKLDMGLVQCEPDETQACTVAAIIAHHERTGAVICAEGIETEDHLERALAYGATLGQGNLFGTPGELTSAPMAFSLGTRTTYSPAYTSLSIFDLATARLPKRTVGKQTLVELSRHIERLAVSAENPPIVLTCLPEDASLYGAARGNCARIAQKSSLVVIFGRNPPSRLGSRVRGVSLDPDDPLSLEWIIVVLGPEVSAGLIAREQRCAERTLGDPQDRCFDMVVTFDRGHVTAVARSLFDRLPESGQTRLA